MVPPRKFSITTSASFTMRRNTSCPGGVLIASVIERLFEL